MSGKFDGKAFLKSVSNAPGVYVMLDKEGEYLYVGKAGNLKKRLASYFRASGLSPKTYALMQHVVKIDTTVTHTESEALLLENNLIKTHRPRFNVVLRDDKSYPYIRLADNHEFPRLGFYRGNRKQPGRYFGPYPSAASVRETLSQLQKVFPVRQCEDTFYRNRSRPCLQFQIDRCTAPCVGLVKPGQYRDDVEQAVLFLQGQDKSLIDSLAKKMEQSAHALDFEIAAKYRDRVAALKRIQEKQYISGHQGDADVVVACLEHEAICVELVTIRNGRNLGNKQFFPKTSLEVSESDVLAAFLPQYYLDKQIPAEIIISHQVPERDLLEQTFSKKSNQRVTLKHRVRGHRARWIKMALNNAQDVLRRKLAGQSTQLKRLEALKELLSLPEQPARMECFDVSHTFGEKTVASCVVFGAEGPIKTDYRRFNIEGVTAGDDYAAISQALERRYRRLQAGEGKLPDVLFIDGGKGQVSAAEKIIEELQVIDVCIIGVAKGPARKAGMERLFLYGDKRSVRLDTTSPALHLIQQIRDEAHRFAITGHRQRRGKARTKSRLEGIEGVGEKRRQALLRQLGGMREVMRAGVDDLASVPGINRTLAERIYDELHQ